MCMILKCLRQLLVYLKLFIRFQIMQLVMGMFWCMVLVMVVMCLCKQVMWLLFCMWFVMMVWFLKVVLFLVMQMGGRLGQLWCSSSSRLVRFWGQIFQFMLVMGRLCFLVFQFLLLVEMMLWVQQLMLRQFIGCVMVVMLLGCMMGVLVFSLVSIFLGQLFLNNGLVYQ